MWNLLCGTTRPTAQYYRPARTPANRGRTQDGSLIAPQMTDIKDVKADGDVDVVVTLTGTNYQYPLLFAGKM